MEIKRKSFPATKSKPRKVLLHMVRRDGNWAGKAIFFGRDEEFNFSNLQELVEWLMK